MHHLMRSTLLLSTVQVQTNVPCHHMRILLLMKMSHSVDTPLDESEPVATDTYFADDDAVLNGDSTDTEGPCQIQATTPFLQLLLWGTQAQIKQVDHRSLLHILHPYHPELPLDVRTLLKTPQNVELLSMGSGNVFYFGIRSALESMLKAHLIPKTALLLHLKFNIDGLLIAKSVTKVFWPTLVLLAECVVDLVVLLPFMLALASQILLMTI